MRVKHLFLLAALSIVIAGTLSAQSRENRELFQKYRTLIGEQKQDFYQTLFRADVPELKKLPSKSFSDYQTALKEFIGESEIAEPELETILNDLLRFGNSNRFKLIFVKVPPNDPVPGFRLKEYDAKTDTFILTVDESFLDWEEKSPSFFYSSVVFCLEECFSYMFDDGYYISYEELNFLVRYQTVMNAANIQARFCFQFMEEKDIPCLYVILLRESKMRDDLLGYSKFILGVNMDLIYDLKGGFIQIRKAGSRDYPEFLRWIIKTVADSDFKSIETKDLVNFDKIRDSYNALVFFPWIACQILESRYGEDPEIFELLQELYDMLSERREQLKQDNESVKGYQEELEMFRTKGLEPYNP